MTSTPEDRASVQLAREGIESADRNRIVRALRLHQEATEQLRHTLRAQYGPTSGAVRALTQEIHETTRLTHSLSAPAPAPPKVNGGRLDAQGRYWIWRNFIIMRLDDSGPYRLSRITGDPADHYRMSLVEIDDFFTLPDAVQAARNEANRETHGIAPMPSVCPTDHSRG